MIYPPSFWEPSVSKFSINLTFYVLNVLEQTLFWKQSYIIPMVLFYNARPLVDVTVTYVIIDNVCYFLIKMLLIHLNFITQSKLLNGLIVLWYFYKNEKRNQLARLSIMFFIAWCVITCLVLMWHNKSAVFVKRGPFRLM